MMFFTVYNAVTGRIRTTGDCREEDVDLQARSGEGLVKDEKIDGAIWYMPGGVKTARPTLAIATDYTIAADGEEAVEFALPAGTRVEALSDGEMWPDEDEFHFSSEEIGTFAFRIYPPFPYEEPFKVTINAS